MRERRPVPERVKELMTVKIVVAFAPPVLSRIRELLTIPPPATRKLEPPSRLSKAVGLRRLRPKTLVVIAGWEIAYEPGASIWAVSAKVSGTFRPVQLLALFHTPLVVF